MPPPPPANNANSFMCGFVGPAFLVSLLPRIAERDHELQAYGELNRLLLTAYVAADHVLLVVEYDVAVLSHCFMPFVKNHPNLALNHSSKDVRWVISFFMG